MGIFEAIKKGFGVSLKALPLVVVLFVFNLIWNLINIPLTPAPGTTPTPQATMIAFIASVIFILTSIFVQSGSLALVRDQLKQGAMKLGSFASYGSKFYVRLFLINLLLILIIFVAALIAGVTVAAAGAVKNAVLTVAATVIAVIVGLIAIYYLLLLAMSPYVLVCEELGAVESLKRSFRVVKRSLLKVLGLIIVVLLITLGIGLLAGFLSGAATAFLPARVGQVIVAIVSSAVNGYLGIVMMGAFIAYYLGLVAQDNAPGAAKVF